MGEEMQEIMAVKCMDHSAAFDTVAHDILLNVLNKVAHDILLNVLNKVFGIMDTALKWFESYLIPRNIC